MTGVLANSLFDMVTAVFFGFSLYVICAAGRERGQAASWTGWGKNRRMNSGKELGGEGWGTSQFLPEMTVPRIIGNLALH